MMTLIHKGRFWNETGDRGTDVIIFRPAVNSLQVVFPAFCKVKP
jgi:hypothetical protein